jgi:hypothetical protein
MLKPILLTAVAALLAGPAAAAVNLVTNGSFEAGLNGWTIGGTDTQGFAPAAILYGEAMPYPIGAFGEAVPGNDATTNSPDLVGEHAAYFVSDFTVDQSLTQMVFLTPGTYQIGFSAYAPANGFANAGDAAFAGSIAGVELANYLVSTGPKTDWKTFAGSTTITTAANYAVSFTFNTNLKPSKDVVIDQVYIIEGNPPVGGVPEASTWAMLIAGFGMVGFAMRSRKAQRAHA